MRIKAEEAEEKRVAYQNDPSLHAKVKVLSIKEQKEQKEARNKQGLLLVLMVGVRLAKTASRFGVLMI